mmetsp:Transcript_40990/g.99920  ORF Transcript_40990/g.99920 Transcript_40990/m.99920 type:complete len:200 (-) Transcript_40990:416-1015(-)
MGASAGPHPSRTCPAVHPGHSWHDPADRPAHPTRKLPSPHASHGWHSPLWPRPHSRNVPSSHSRRAEHGEHTLSDVAVHGDTSYSPGPHALQGEQEPLLSLPQPTLKCSWGHAGHSAHTPSLPPPQPSLYWPAPQTGRERQEEQTLFWSPLHSLLSYSSAPHSTHGTHAPSSRPPQRVRYELGGQSWHSRQAPSSPLPH